MSDDQISDDEMSDDQISDDWMSDDQISDDWMSDDQISDGCPRCSGASPTWSSLISSSLIAPTRQG
jgi:hypothetical protein